MRASLADQNAGNYKCETQIYEVPPESNDFGRALTMKTARLLTLAFGHM